MRLILTRHYKTRNNEDNRIMGWGDSPPGSDWKVDIDFVDDCMRRHGLEIDAVYSSELERSRQTAIIHAVRFGIPMVNSSGELNEVNYGRLLNQDKDSVARQYPQHKKDPDLVYPGGESFHQMQQRSVGFLTSLARSHPRETVLVVSHAGVIRGIVSHFLDLDYADHLKQRISFRYIGDLHLKNGNCIRYDELGKPSGFAESGAVDLPYTDCINAN